MSKDFEGKWQMVTHVARDGAVPSLNGACPGGPIIDGVEMDFCSGKRDPITPGNKLTVSVSLWLTRFTADLCASICNFQNMQLNIFKLAGTLPILNSPFPYLNEICFIE